MIRAFILRVVFAQQNCCMFLFQRTVLLFFLLLLLPFKHFVGYTHYTQSIAQVKGALIYTDSAFTFSSLFDPVHSIDELLAQEDSDDDDDDDDDLRHAPSATNEQNTYTEAAAADEYRFSECPISAHRVVPFYILYHNFKAYIV